MASAITTQIPGYPPLHLACFKGDEEEVKRLIEQKADVHGRTDDREYTPLHVAVENGREKVVQILLENDAASDIVVGDHEKDTPLHIAAVNANNANILQALFQKLWATETGKPVDYKNAKNRTPLHYAASRGVLSAVEFLLEHKADMNAVDEADATPFHFAARTGNIEIMEKLMVDIHMTSNGKLSALHYAAWNGRNQAVQWLLEKGASVKATDVRGDTALHFAARRGCSDVIRTLLLHKANVFAPNKKGEQIMGLAHEFENGDVVLQAICDALKEVEAETKIETMNFLASHTDGTKLLHYAAAYGRSGDVKWVVAKIRDSTARKKEGKDKNFQLNVNVKDSSGRNPMHWAAIKGNTDVIEILQKSKVNSLAGDTENKTPLCLSLIHHQLPFVKMLHHSLGEHLTSEQWMTDIQMWTDTFDEKLRKTKLGHIIDEMPPIYKALYTGNEETVKVIQGLNKGAVDFVNMKGAKSERTALHWATILKQTEIVSMLCKTNEFEKDLIANMLDKEGKIPLDYDTEMEITKELLKRREIQSHLDGLYRDRQVYVDPANAILVGAALIATVTFAGWINEFLDSYSQHVGLKVFWASNCLSFFFSMATVLAAAGAVLPMPRGYIAKAVSNIRRALLYAATLFALSIICVLVAFVSAGFVVLPSSSKYRIIMVITVVLGGLTSLCFLANFLRELCKFRPQRIRTIEDRIKKALGYQVAAVTDCIKKALGYQVAAVTEEPPVADAQLHQGPDRAKPKDYTVGSRYDYLPWDDGLDNLPKPPSET